MEALVVAVIGVCGTLCATWIGQRSAERATAAERSSAERLRRLDESARAAERMADLRRGNYIALNQAARRYFGVLNDALHALPPDRGAPDRGAPEPDGAEQDGAEQDGPGPDGPATELDEVRGEYRACYAQAQMVVPDPVLAVASAVNRELNQAYGIVKRLQSGTQRESDGPQRIRAHLDAARDRLHELRREMRADLGVAEVTSPRRPPDAVRETARSAEGDLR
ncbi:hypothetical protein [Streptomyces sp. NRRL S-87]|uniref:hypothetical protein n=1 Tax=Streptomyces sp. NRRL S-87 TaxID=1463920 RepID=UPI0007C5B0C8|nr:hypothetical protein [Streptomyces sp. NRRL S-87]